MRPQFHPALINEPDGDPGVYIDFLFAKRAVLFDLGDLHQLPAKKILRVTDVFISHAHMDHFFGFDWLVRLCLGRNKLIRIYGPAGIVSQVEAKLSGYTWNLVHNYVDNLVIEVTAVDSMEDASRATFRCHKQFCREDEQDVLINDGCLLDEPGFRVRFTILDHKIPYLSYSLQETQHLNIWKNKLEELGLPTGPWLQEFKRAIMENQADEARFTVRWRDSLGQHAKTYPLGELKQSILRIVPGQKISYITDIAFHEQNVSNAVSLIKGSDILFIESPFMQRDAERAFEKAHLTAHQAGTMARLAKVKQVIPFHFSPIYHAEYEALKNEVEQAFQSK